MENNKKTILVVDDEIGALTLISLVLESKGGFSVLKAHNSVSALEVLKNQTPDLIIADIMMPGIDGIELCRRIKADSSTKEIPVILLTARSDQKDQGVAAGAAAYLLKPILYNNLVQTASKLLNKNDETPANNMPAPVADKSVEATTPADQKSDQSKSDSVEHTQAAESAPSPQS